MLFMTVGFFHLSFKYLMNIYTLAQGIGSDTQIRASHMDMDPEKTSWSQSGLAEAREEGRWEHITSRGRGPTKVQSER